MSKKKLSREEKNKIKEEQKQFKLENLRKKTFPKHINVPTQEIPRNIEIPSPEIIIKSEKVSLSDGTPRIENNPDIYKSMLVEFELCSKDVVGNWSWGTKRSLLDTEFKSIIEPYLEHPKNTKWGTIENERYGQKNKTKHHHIPVGRLQDEVQERWKEINLLYPEVFTFRVSGKKRIFGYRIINKYFIVWWDPPHKIIPQ